MQEDGGPEKRTGDKKLKKKRGWVQTGSWDEFLKKGRGGELEPLYKLW